MLFFCYSSFQVEILAGSEAAFESLLVPYVPGVSGGQIDLSRN